MPDLVRGNLRWFGWLTAAGLLLRVFFLFHFPAITPDSLFYGDIAKNWLRLGVYGVTSVAGVSPTYIRLPGYPAFLAGVFGIFGMEHYRAVLAVQVCFDLATCFLLAELARKTASERAGKIAFLLSTLCPFLASYPAAALTESLEIFATVLALSLAVSALDRLRDGQGSTRTWAACGAATGTAILLRPDGVILLAGMGAYLMYLLLTSARGRRGRLRGLLMGGIICAGVAVLPLVPWTLRNLHAMHRFEPLAPRYANDPGEFVPIGFQRWTRTWVADFVSTEEVYWKVEGETVDPAMLPARAFDSEQQRQETLKLVSAYDATRTISPELDQQFEALAQERIRDSPLRYFVWLPALRIVDMWARPRTELLPVDTRWWEFDESAGWLAVTLLLGALNVLYLGAALAGAAWGVPVRYAGLFGDFVLLRSIFLGSLENPEPRYTLECYPVVILFAAALLASSRKRQEELAER